MKATVVALLFVACGACCATDASASTLVPSWISAGTAAVSALLCGDDPIAAWKCAAAGVEAADDESGDGSAYDASPQPPGPRPPQPKVKPSTVSDIKLLYGGGGR